MKFLRHLKVLSVTVGAVVVVGSLVVFAIVPRAALVDYFPVLQGIFPPPEEKPKPVEPKDPTVTVLKKPEPVVALPETITESVPSEDEQSLARDKPEKPPEAPKLAVEEVEEEVDIDDPGVLEEIAEKATKLAQLRVRWHRGMETASDQDGPFTGWAKRIHSKNGQVEELGRFADGLRDGLWVQWSKNGQKRMQGHYKNGRQEGVWTQWKSNGVIAKEYTYVNGKKSRAKIELDQDGRRRRWREMLEERERLRQEKKPMKSRLLPEGKDESGGAYALVKGGTITEHKDSALSHALTSEGEAIALRELPEPATRKLVLKTSYKSLAQGKIKNAAIAFGDIPKNDALLKAGTAIGMNAHVLFPGSWENVSAGAQRAMRPNNISSFDITLAVDLAKRSVTATINERSLTFPLPEDIKQIRYFGPYVKATSSAFAPIEIVEAK